MKKKSSPLQKSIYIQDPVADIICIGSSGHILEVVKYRIIWLELPPGTGTGTGLTGTTEKLQSSRYASLTIFQRLLKSYYTTLHRRYGIKSHLIPDPSYVFPSYISVLLSSLHFVSRIATGAKKK
jgi:hypothetical protein